MPEWERFVKCGGCQSILFKPSLAASLGVCECGHHHPLNVHQRISMLFDDFEFAELDVMAGDPLDFPGLDEKLAGLRNAGNVAPSSAGGGVLGVAVRSFFFDFDFIGGTIGSAEAEVITRAYERATAERKPILGVVRSGGARVQEGLFSLFSVPKMVCGAAQHRDAGLVSVLLLADPVMASPMISFIPFATHRLAEPGARVSFAGGRVKGHDTEVLAEQQLEWGLVTEIVERRHQRSTIRKLLAAPAESANPG
ncbi:MAG: hypothetical protein KIS66_06315 [Fimbriimonadaceae bacterium]|nr:hypothetical protein [Fimbriimonadaceae bacterium]